MSCMAMAMRAIPANVLKSWAGQQAGSTTAPQCQRNRCSTLCQDAKQITIDGSQASC